MEQIDSLKVTMFEGKIFRWFHESLAHNKTDRTIKSKKFMKVDA